MGRALSCQGEKFLTVLRSGLAVLDQGNAMGRAASCLGLRHLGHHDMLTSNRVMVPRPNLHPYLADGTLTHPLKGRGGRGKERKTVKELVEKFLWKVAKTSLNSEAKW
ncbi:hypothetical protein MRB53_008822 [Persea americana]|uniref:Uncharacterized protein n=1 Tax=Persea americana TaxID=3435 RepID=A0ACC2LMF5_PERAE|nr:hypothetical protein MRB53_008822 [Persea americana]